MKRLWSNAVMRIIVVLAATAAVICWVGWAFSLTDPLPMQADLTQFEGSGTKEDPFQIATREDLARLRDLVNEGDALAWGHFVQTADIDLLAEGEDEAALNWEPIGPDGTRYYFYGDYDGGGHTIAHLRSVDRERAGLFDRLCGTVRNLGISSGEISGGDAAAIAVTLASSGEDVANTPASEAVILNCWNAATVTGVNIAVGICRNCQGTIESCWNIGTVTCQKGSAAGIKANEAGTLDNCVSVGALPTASTILADEEDALWCATPEDAVAHMADWYVGLLDYATEPTYGEVTAAPVWTAEGGLAFEPMENVVGGGTTAYAQAVIDGMVVAQGALIALAVLAVGVVVARCVAARGDDDGSARGGQSLVGDTPRSGSTDERPQGTVPRGLGDTHASRVWRQRLAGIAVFVAVFCVIGGAVNLLLENKNVESVNMERYYDQPEGTVDMLGLGSSRLGYSTDIGALWHDYGIAGYSLYSGIESFWNSYDVLREALRVNPPKVVVLEAHAAFYDFEYIYEEYQFRNTNGIEDPLTKLQSVRISSPQKSWMNMWLGFPVYHARFDELTRSDLDLPAYEDFKGSFPRYGSIGENEPVAAWGSDEVHRMLSKEETYLRGIVDLLREYDIPLVLYAAPTCDYEKREPYYNAVETFAAEEGIAYLDLNTIEGDDRFVLADFTDGAHLNTSGGRKVARLLGTYLRDNFGLEDHRGDERYASWDRAEHLYENDYLKLITNIQEYAAELRRDGRTVLIAGHWVSEGDYAGLRNTLVAAGLSVPQASQWESRDAQLWVLPDTSSEVVAHLARNGRLTLRTHEISYGIEGASAVFDKDEPIVTFDGSGIALIVYDEETDEIIDKVTIPAPVADGQMNR